MKRTTNKATSGHRLLRVQRPSIIISPAMQGMATVTDIRMGLRQHQALGRLPIGFVGRRGKKFMVVTTADLSKTLFMLADEMEDYTKHLTLRELNETTVNE